MGGYAPNILGISAPAEAGSLNRLSDLIMNALAEDAPFEVTAEHVEQAVESRRQMYEQLENNLFLPLHRFDKGKTEALIRRSREMTPSNADIGVFVRKYFETHEGHVENTRQKHVVRLRTPRCLLDGKTVLEQYPVATFDKDTAFTMKSKDVQFVAFGHPLLAAIIRDCKSRVPRLRGAATVKCVPRDALSAMSGVLFTYVLRHSDAQDRTLSEELLAVHVASGSVVDCGDKAQRLLRLSGTAIADPQSNMQVVDVVAMLDDFEAIAQEKAAAVAQAAFERVQADRARQADASLASLDAFRRAKASRLDGMLQNYQQRLFDGEDMDIAIRRAIRA